MRREPKGFYRRVPELNAVWFDSVITGKRHNLSRPLATALETAWLAGAMEVLGCALGWPGDDVRARALALQRQAADRLAEIRDRDREANLQDSALTRANGEVKRRVRNRRFD
ncbi:hypothetical protein E1N52_41610 [Paraburkholderia guartelaensis]|uniref:Uncharacterized protein n=1 Tax=Paraburkholderia guartelaensis TaxID=2546446 RepID=A0A4R5L0V5_9BURK|nr:hypothetical protein [Paraburkholderia guartelaensis]TDG02090.1 hypothetical protein E1N52_41610 [Paraburkholderia guartelaensis]